MSINQCNLCNDPCLKGIIGNNSMEEKWRTLVAQALCTLVGNSPAVLESTQLDQVALTAAVITSTYSAYASPTFIDSNLLLRRLSIVNQTDADIEVSLDAGSSTHFRVTAYSTRELEVGNKVFALATDFQIRKASGMTASTGNVYIEGGY